MIVFEDNNENQERWTESEESAEMQRKPRSSPPFSRFNFIQSQAEWLVIRDQEIADGREIVQEDTEAVVVTTPEDIALERGRCLDSVNEDDP